MAPKCWKHLCSTIPLLLGSGITKFFSISRYETPLTAPSKEYRPNDTTASYSCLCHRVWWVVFHPKRVAKTMFDPTKIFSDKKLRLIANPSEKRTLPQGKAVENRFYIKAHASYRLLYQYCCIRLQTLVQMTSLLGPTCGPICLNVVLQFLLIFSVWTCVAIFQRKLPHRQKSNFGILADCFQENLSYSSKKKARFFHDTRVAIREMASQTSAETMSTPDSSSDLCCFLCNLKILNGINTNICHCHRRQPRTNNGINATLAIGSSRLFRMFIATQCCQVIKRGYKWINKSFTCQVTYRICVYYHTVFI